MPPIMIAAAAAIATGISGLAWLLFAPRDRSRSEILANATQGFGDPTAVDAPKPGRLGLTDLARRLTPGSVVKRLDHHLSLAGRPAAWPLDRLLLARLLLPCPAIALALLFVSGDPGMGRIALSGIVVVVSHFVPDLLLKSRG